MNYEDFTRIIDSLGRLNDLWLSGQGEPLLNPHLPRMIQYCAERGITGTIVHTNGMQLRGPILQKIAAAPLGRLLVSIDGGNKDDMESIREGSDLHRILDNVRAFTQVSRTPVVFYVVLNRMNHTSVPLIPKLAREAGARGLQVVETVPFRDTTTQRETYDRREYQFCGLAAEVQRHTIEDLRRAARAERLALHIDLKWYRTRCDEPMRKIYVDFRGNVTPCCRIHHEVFVGNILKEGRDPVWYGAAMQRWRKALHRRSEHPRLCVERCNLGIGPRP
jgi:molybdenum cofactor biosynthesis enzyme MoaA